MLVKDVLVKVVVVKDVVVKDALAMDDMRGSVCWTDMKRIKDDMKDDMKGIKSTWSMSGRCCGLKANICAMRSRKYLLYFALIGGYLPLTIFPAKPFNEFASKAWFNVVISYKTQPNAHTSDL